MVEPTGYTALDLIGFTDKGPYDPTANYVRNDLVHVGNSTWRCKIDDTTGITPTEGANWTIFIESATSLAGMSDVDLNTPKAGDGLVHDGNDWTNIPITTKEQWKKNGAYNLLPKELYASTQVSHGITWTVHSDGSVGTSNTSKDNTNEAFVLFSRTLGYTVPAGQYKFCGKPSASKYRMMLQCTRGGVLTILADLDYGTTSAVVTIQEGDALQVSLTVKSGETGGDTFYPLLTTDLSATNADFTTPAKTNRELTEELTVKSISATLNSTYFGAGDSIKVYRVGNIVEVVLNASTIANIPSGNIDITTDGKLPTPAVGDSIIGMVFDRGNKTVIAQTRIITNNLNVPFTAIPSGTSIGISLTYICK